MISLRRYRIAAFAGVTMPLAALALSACVSQQATNNRASSCSKPRRR